MLKPRALERIVKGFANHRRIQILELIDKKPEQSVQDISRSLNINFKTASDHIRRLTIAGLVLKRNRASNVLHKVSPLGNTILQFLRKLE